MRIKKTLLGLVAIVVVVAAVAGLTARDADGVKLDTVNVQLLGFNDYHGNLEPPAGGGGRIGSVDAGGVEYFATHIANL
ncbi:MAG: bifunctional metallophosphatase/5'-nucleotidase, partial [Actinomycetota bacterium]|nr:bifunctional metallophosphatase/5'-nucleotidase [Actinomycetota bacterium]